MGKTNSILVVNSDKEILKKIKSELTKNGFLACAENSSKEALDTLSAIQTDVIIIDVEVLKNSEIDLYNEIRSKKQYAQTPVFLSADPKDQKVKQLAGTKGITAVLSNPLNIEEIFTYIPKQNNNTLATKQPPDNTEEDIFDINNNSENGLLRFKYTINHSSAGIIITNKNSIIQYVNFQYCKQTGYTKEELIGKNPKILSAGSNSKEKYKGLWNTILSGHTWIGEFENRKKSGELFWEKATITPVKNNLNEISHFIAVKENITERKIKEQQIEQLKISANNIIEQAEKTESCFNSFFNHSIDCVAFLDNNYNFTKVNNLFAQTLHKKIVDFTGKNYFEMFPSNLIDDFEKAKIDKKIFRKKAFPFVSPDSPEQGITYFDTTLTPILDDLKQIQMFILSLNNVTNDIKTLNSFKDEIEKNQNNTETYKQLTNSISEVFFALNTQLNITFWNKACEELTQIKAKNAIGKNIDNIFSNPQNIKYFDEKLQEVVKIQKNIKFNKKININNNLYYFKINVSPFKSGISVLMQNITEKKEAELKNIETIETTKKEKNILKTFFENLSQGACIFQIIHGETEHKIDYKFLFISKTIEKITSINADICLNKTVKTVLPKIDQTLINHLEKATLINKTASFEYFNQETKKHYNIIINPHQKNFLSVIYIDITNSKNIEKSLISTKQKFEEIEIKHKKITESMFLGFCLLNENGNIIEANKNACNILGLNENEILNCNFIKNRNFENLSELNKQFEQVKTSKKTHFETKYKNNNKTADLIVHLEYSTSNEYKYIIFLQDITEKNINKLQIINDKNKALNNESLKTKFLTNLSHSIKTPLNGIIGFSDLLQKENLKPERKNNYIQVIKNSSEQLIKIIDGIIEISNLNSSTVEISENEACLNDILIEQFSLFDLKAKKNNTPLYIKKELSDIESTVFIDENKLSRIINIFLDNAISYTNTGHVEVGYKLNNNNIEVFVKDSGIGISNEDQKNIFNQFAKISANSKDDADFGLGLSIAKEYSKLLGAKITVESTIDVGSTFIISFPYKPVYFEKDSFLNKTKKKIEEKIVSIVVAEDEEINFLYIETLLESFFDLNCKIIHCINGIETVETCLKERNIDLILMDLKMPDLDGFEAAKQIKKIRPQIPIIAQTAYTSKNDKQKAFISGCDDFITKPIKKEALEAILKKFQIINN